MFWEEREGHPNHKIILSENPNHKIVLSEVSNRFRDPSQHGNYF